MKILPFPQRDNSIVGWLVLTVAVILALVSARQDASSWNDGSRLATVEVIVDHHTLAIDQSIFVQVPPADGSPYPSESELLQEGTKDKLWINGHFYSDKSPLPAVFLAAIYQTLQWTTGLTARDDPHLFCYLMTLASSGLAYVVAVGCTYRLGRSLRLSQRLCLLLTASFGLSTVALTYARQVNNHILLLGVASALMLALTGLAEHGTRRPASWGRLLAVGTLAGLGYTVDLGVGPVLLVGTLGLAAYRCGLWRGCLVVGLAAAPWVSLHHGLNYAVGGTFGPANAVPAYFGWPGCPFNATNLTGGWHHASLLRFAVYALALLFGKQGFVGHNLPLFLFFPGLAALLWRRSSFWPELLFAACCCGGTWLVYAVNSRNYSGACCSIRWFVPLLAPAYYVLARVLRDCPAWRGDFLLLSCWGTVLALIMWCSGPWIQHMVLGFWPIQAATLFSWGIWRAWCWGHESDNASAWPRGAAGNIMQGRRVDERVIGRQG